jgi:hypothetical protein
MLTFHNVKVLQIRSGFYYNQSVLPQKNVRALLDSKSNRPKDILPNLFYFLIKSLKLKKKILCNITQSFP